MKKLLLLLPMLMLFLACELQEEATPEPYNGTWASSYETFEFDNDDFNYSLSISGDDLELRGDIVKVDDNTITLKYKEAKSSSGNWGTITSEYPDKTFDWVIVGSTMTLTDTSGSSVRTLTKQ